MLGQRSVATQSAPWLMVFCLLLAHVAAAYEPDVTHERDEIIPGESDRLIPGGSGIIAIPDPRCPRCLAEFGSYPSFKPTYEWQIELEGKKYVLSSWRLVNPKSDVDFQKVEVLKVEVTKQFAQVVYDIWANTILEARYTRHSPSGLDGTNYRFRTALRGVGWPSARVWSPRKELPPKWMVESGEEIMTLARAKSPNEAPLLTKLLTVRKRLDDYYRPPRDALQIQP